MENKKKVFLKNTIMLYILQFSTYIFSFATVPYQTRVLEAVNYGYLGVAVALMTYFQLVMDFGFLLSATADIAANRHDHKKLCRIYTSVNIIKLVLCAVSFVAMIAVCSFVPKFKGNFLLYLLYFAAYAINAFLPDYLYRGLEKMSGITYRTVAVKALFTVLVFVFIKDPDDYLLVPVLLGIGNLIAVVWANIDVQKNLKIRFCSVTFKEVWANARHSAFFFLSRIATTIYTTTNTVILGASNAVSETVTGFYTAADRLITTGKGVLSPISDSAYPYMLKNKDFKLVKKILLLIEPAIIVFCIGVFIFADPLCGIVFGEEYVTAELGGLGCTTGDILRAMLPVAVFTLPNYILGFPTLGALGYNREVNISIIAGTCIHLLNLGIFWGFDMINAVTLAILTSVSEGLILAFRVGVLIVHRKEINEFMKKKDGI